VIFDESTPIETLEVVRPHVHVKGGDYTGQTLPERATVERHGGVVEFVPVVPGRSTTRLLGLLRSDG
jgi:glycerol-3-phosphate cytidylyltransferase